MDSLTRGSIERFLDDILEKERILEGAVGMFEKRLSPTVKHIEDALFGYVIGRTLQLAFDAIKVRYGRMLTDAESAEIAKMLERRAMEIKSKITLIANR